MGTYGRSTPVEVSQTKVVSVPLIGTSVNLSDEKDDNCIAYSSLVRLLGDCHYCSVYHRGPCSIACISSQEKSSDTAFLLPLMCDIRSKLGDEIKLSDLLWQVFV